MVESPTSTRTNAMEPEKKRRLWWQQALAFTRRHVQQLVRSRVVLFLIVGWPLLWFALAVGLFVEEADPNQIAAIGVQFGLFGALTVTLAVFSGEFARDLASDRYRKFRALPLAPTADLAGRFLAGSLVGALSYVATVVGAYVAGGQFTGWVYPSVWIPIILTLLVFCLIATSVAVVFAAVFPKPEYMTTIAVIGALIVFYITGQSRVVPWMIPGDPSFVNLVPNSLATRLQITAWIEAGAGTTEFMTPPPAPDLARHGSLLVGYAAGLVAVSIGTVRLVAYGRRQ